MSDYIQNSLTALEKLFEPGLSRTNGENNTNNYLLQVYYRDPSFLTYKSIQSELKKKWITVSYETQEKEGQKAFNIRDPVTKKSPYNYQQQRLLDQMATYLQELESDLKPQSKLLLLYGGPGVGKTHTIIAMVCATGYSNYGIYGKWNRRVRPNWIHRRQHSSRTNNPFFVRI
jgi:chromosomal replication initiation ATPase DnaA